MRDLERHEQRWRRLNAGQATTSWVDGEPRGWRRQGVEG